MIDLEVRHEENIHKSVVRTFGLSENGSVKKAGIAIDALLKNRYTQFNDINDRVFKQILLSSQKYSARLKKQLNFFQNRIAKLNNKCNQSKNKLFEEWNKYQNVLNRRLKSMQTKENNPAQAKNKNNEYSNSNDPFLCGK